MEMEISTKVLFIEIFNWFREKNSKSSNYFNERTFIIENFSSKFFTWKKWKKFNKSTFFKIFKQVGENSTMPSGTEHLITTRKFFQLDTWQNFLKSMNKNFLNLENLLNHRCHQIFYWKYYIVFATFCGELDFFILLRELNWNFLKATLNFLKVNKSNVHNTDPKMFWIDNHPKMFWIDNQCYMSSFCVALLLLWRRYCRDGTPCTEYMEFCKLVKKNIFLGARFATV